MQLSSRDVCKFLNVSEYTLNRWIKQRGLPCHHVGGKDRFNRAELLEWASANQVTVSMEMFGSEDEEHSDSSLCHGLEAGGIFYGLEGEQREQALRALVKVLPLPQEVDRDEVFQLFLAREALMSTAIGNGIALPHVRNPIVLHVDRPMVALCFLKNPVDFGALDGKPVRVFFSLVCPTMRAHLQMLSRLSHALLDTGFRQAIERQGAREEILGEAARVDEAIAAAAGATKKAGRSAQSRAPGHPR